MSNPMQGIVTSVFDQMNDAFSQGASNLVSSAKSLLTPLCMIDLALSVMFNLEEDALSILFGKILKYGFHLYLIENYVELKNILLETFKKIGQTAGGGSSVNISPESIMKSGFSTAWKVFVDDKTSVIGAVLSLFPSLHDLTIFIFCLLIIVTTVWFAVELMINILEFHIVATIGVVLIPFGVIKHTKFLADKTYSALFNTAIKVGMMVSIYSITQKILGNLTITENDLGSYIVYFGVTLCCLLITGRAKHISMMFASGSGGSGIVEGIRGGIRSAVSTAVSTVIAAKTGGLAAASGGGTSSAVNKAVGGGTSGSSGTTNNTNVFGGASTTKNESSSNSTSTNNTSNTNNKNENKGSSGAGKQEANNNNNNESKGD